jgi:hypothetical protein
MIHRNVNKEHKDSLSVSDRMAIWLTHRVGTMACAFIFLLLTIPALAGITNITSAVNWLSSNCIQLVMLPLLMVGQALLSRHSETRAEIDHEKIIQLEGVLLRLEREQLANAEVMLVLLQDIHKNVGSQER